MNRILLISHIFPPAVDGGSRVIFKLGQQFEAKKHTTLYLSSNCSSTDDFVNNKVSLFKGKTPQLQRKDFIKLPVYHLRRPLRLLEFFCTKLLFINPKSYFINLIKIFQKGPIFKFLPFLKATIKILKFRPNIIIAGPLPTTIILYASFFKFLTKVLMRQNTKILINASFHPTNADFHQKPLIKALQSADYLWTLTQFETNYFTQKFSINSKKIILAGNGVDSDFLKTSKVPRLVKEGVRERFNILFIGSLSAHKRVDLLIKSFSLLLKTKSYSLPTKLIIAGQKTLFYPQIKKTLDNLDFQTKSKIKFIYNFPQNKLANLIDNCTFLVLPSIQESFGLVIIEAWARGKPVIVSNIPSLSELVKHSHGGLIFKPDNLDDLQTKIKKLINSPALCYQYGQNGLKYVKTNYTWEKVSQKISQKLKLS